MVPQRRCDPEPKCCARRPIAADPECNRTAADVRSREKPPLLNFVAGFVAVAGARKPISRRAPSLRGDGA
jgi:hypothetical protein